MTKFLKFLFLTAGLVLVPSSVSSNVVYSGLKVRAVSPETIFQASVEAWKQSKTEEAAYLFYAGKLRAVCDAQLFPPKAKGEDNPFILLNTISHVIGKNLNSEIMNYPEGYRKVIARIATLDPVPEIGYKPSWEYEINNDVEKAKRTCLSYKDEYIKLYQRLSALLLNKNYFSTFKRVREYNLFSPAQRLNSANKRRIEIDILKLKKIEVEEFGDSFIWNKMYADEV